MKPFIILVVPLVLVAPSAGFAGEKGQLESLLADYDVLKERVQDVRDARKSGHVSDSKMLMDLFGESARQGKRRSYSEQHTKGTMNKLTKRRAICL